MRGIITDPTPIDAPKDPAHSTPLSLIGLIATPEEASDCRQRYERGGVGYLEIKERLITLLMDFFASARDRYATGQVGEDYAGEMLAEGAARARILAGETLVAVRRACGL